MNSGTAAVVRDDRPDLPRPLTSFVGREDELRAVRAVLDEQRLVTLAGPGGGGKTRLAIAAAGSVADRWPDGVAWVDLGPICDPALVTRAVASAARVVVDSAGNPLAALTAQLRHRRGLLCLDTCEHLLDACAELVDALLRGCPDLSVLATSREPLGVSGEAVWRVPPLALAQAVRLFVDRAMLAHAGYPADDPARHAEEELICRRLDGIPLAVELAAAWVRALPPAEIAARLDDRFRLLTGGPRLVADRHRTLAASLTWSHDLLDEPDRVLFRRLAVFAGGFTVDAADAVCADPGLDVLDALRRLVDKSLIVAGRRYRMLDTVREYAQERLHDAGETAAVRDRHLAHHLALAEHAAVELERDQDRWRTILDAAHDNLRAAVAWGLAAPDPEPGRRLAAALGRFWYVRGHVAEGLAILERALALGTDDAGADEATPVQAALLSAAAWTAAGGGRPEQVGALARRGAAVAEVVGEEGHRARCLVMIAYETFFTDFAALHATAAQAGQSGAAADDPVAVDYAALLRARSFTNRDRHAEAVVEIGDMRVRAQARGDRGAAGFALGVEVWAALFTGEVARAVELGREALALAAPLEDYFTVGHMAFNLGWALGLAGDLDAADAVIDPVIRAVTEASPDLFRWFALVPGRLQLWRGDLDGALRWLEAAAVFAEPMADNWHVAQVLPALAGTLRRLGHTAQAHDQATRALALAEHLDMPHARADALDELGRLAAAGGDHPRAADAHQQALATRVGAGLRTFWPDSLEALAAVTADPRVALRLLAAAEAGRVATGHARPPVDAADHDALAGRLREALDPGVADDEQQRGAALSLDDAVAYATRARGTRTRPASGWAALTPAEHQVVDLVAEGLTNPEIGTRLFMSRSTVKTHLAHVYAKLGVANRTELATLATRR